MTDLNNLNLDHPHPGPVVLFGSGETSPGAGKVFDRLVRELPPAARLALLETPAGFEPNSAWVIERVAEFLRRRLQNYAPQIAAVPARRRGTPNSPDNEDIAAPLLEADLIFMGPGSPTYAVRQLRDSLAWHYLQARHRLGAPLVLASAAVIAISACALPVYEIYKAGEDLHWKAGLDFFGAYGLPLVFIPHWNNTDGGEALDTSRCFMGQRRFAELVDLLPPDLTIVGIDESTALILDLELGFCQVSGTGGVTLIHTGHLHSHPGPDLAGTGLAQVAAGRGGHIHIYDQDATFPLSECCPLELQPVLAGLPPAAWKAALQVRARQQEARQAAGQPAPVEAPPEVRALADERQAARARRDWSQADALRARIAEMGWSVVDTPDGPVLKPAPNQ